MKLSVALAIVLLSVVSLAHLLRVLFRIPVVVGGYAVPQWMSVLGCACALFAAGFLWYDNRKTTPW